MSSARDRSLRALGAQLVGIRAQVDAALTCLEALLDEPPAPVVKLEPPAPVHKSFGQSAPPPPIPRAIDVPPLGTSSPSSETHHVA